MDDARIEIEEHLPLTDLSYQILLSVAAGDLHGYAILKAIADRDRTRKPPETGTLYTAIRRLLRDGLVQLSSAQTRGRRGRAYALSPLGRLVLREETGRLGRLVAEARAIGLDGG